ncbi:Uncharacterized protein APZ42_031309 [Daphnia magna]|uniref:Uncharacterized protein n=1 Tax=Daphnia magna TaxID=35525 RepID=A0A164MYV3_9CRUS|nr:Uncharacterized protein APZ42_031309 [Daphnia magna]
MEIINEMGYKTRRSNVILMAIWFGNKKTSENLLNPCVKVLEKPSDDSQPKYSLRSTIQYRIDLKEAIKSGKTSHGIKGPTLLANIADFDFIGTFIPEYMRCICFGGIFREPYFSHVTNLSYALSVLLQESVPTRCVEDVGVLLGDFIKKVELYYGEKMIGLSNTYEIQNYKCLKIEEDIPFSLLGRQVRRHLSMDEQSVVQTILLQEENKIALIVIENIVRFIEKTACDFYSRLFLRSGSNSTFTRSPYVRSKKRINFFSLLNDNRFFLIENLVSVEEAKQNFKVFILGHPMGQGYKKNLFSKILCQRMCPFTWSDHEIYGFDLEAIFPYQIVRKCVIAAFNSKLPSLILTAQTNTLEMD